jgi:hypothetical protein
MRELTTVATFTYSYEAYSLKGRLEAEGIICFLENENIVTANPFYSNAVGGVQIRVKREDEQRALEIISEANKDGNEFSAEMPTDEEISALPKEPVSNGDSKIMRLFGWVFGR